MLDAEEKRALFALSAEKDDIQTYVHDPSPRVLRSLVANININEQDILAITNRKNLPADILETIAKDKRWTQNYEIRLALARNPRSPLSVSLSLARFLRLFDLEEITRNHSVPLVFRHKIEAMIIERIPTMPLGNKKSIAKKAAGAVLVKLLQDRIQEVVALSLNNPHMTEAHLFKVITRPEIMPETVFMIAEHPVWSSRPLIRLSLVRNFHTPLSVSVQFLNMMKLIDLRELYADPLLPVTVKPFVHRELMERGRDPEKEGKDVVYELEDEEADAWDNEVLELGILLKDDIKEDGDSNDDDNTKDDGAISGS